MTHYALLVSKKKKHLLGKCCATMQTRHHMLGAYTLQLEELCRISPSSLLWFAKASLRLK